jgi:hypothetical protein
MILKATGEKPSSLLVSDGGRVRLLGVGSRSLVICTYEKDANKAFRLDGGASISS